MDLYVWDKVLYFAVNIWWKHFNVSILLHYISDIYALDNFIILGKPEVHPINF